MTSSNLDAATARLFAIEIHNTKAIAIAGFQTAIGRRERKVEGKRKRMERLVNVVCMICFCSSVNGNIFVHCTSRGN